MGKYSITVENFSKSFGDLKAVDGLSFEVNDGEVFAFLGANGSGKTTTIRCLLKIYQKDSGKLLINGEEFSEKFNSKIGYLPEERGLYKGVTTSEILEYTAKLRGLSSTQSKKRSDNYLEYVGLSEHKDKKVSQLSSGMQQKVQLGTALIHNPEILILDEPFKGLDPVNRQLFIDIFVDRARKGTTILYSTHVIDEAQKMADSLLIIKDGKKLEYGKVNDVRKKYGSNNLILDFNGKAPQKDTDLYSSVISNKTIEITPKKDVTTEEIVSLLIQNGTKIVKLELDYPSLNQIFIELMKK